MLTHQSFVKKAEEVLRNMSSGEKAYLCYTDFAEFKLVNRYYGVPQGDALLKAALDYLELLPRVAVWERVFSDRFLFVVVTDEKQSDGELVEQYTRHTEMFLSRYRPHYPACNLRTHCGIYPVAVPNVLEAVDYAVLAWREAKKKLVPGAVLFDHAMLETAAMFQAGEQEVNLALQEGRFLFYLQPKVDLYSGEIVGAEALARRCAPDGSIVYPDAFLSIMEGNGTVVDLDWIILRRVCAHLADRLKRGLPVVRTSVNLSRLHLRVPGTAQRLHDMAQEHGVPPELLEFELTETIMLNEFAEAKRFCQQLRGYGYTMSIDDYGAGYAGVNILQELDFDVLKLDRRFLSSEEPFIRGTGRFCPISSTVCGSLGSMPSVKGWKPRSSAATWRRLAAAMSRDTTFPGLFRPKCFTTCTGKPAAVFPLPLGNRKAAPAVNGHGAVQIPLFPKKEFNRFQNNKGSPCVRWMHGGL